MIQKTLFSLFLVLLGLSAVEAQCLEGNCQNGIGKYKLVLNGKYISTYEGHFIDGKYDGKGKLTTSKGDTYEGEWKGGLLNGQGIRFFKDGRAEGGVYENGKLVQRDPKIQAVSKCLSGDCMNGKGVSRDAKGRIFEGNFERGVYTGYGILKYPNGDRYEGLFAKGLPHGKGSYYYRNGHVDTGLWENGRLSGNKFKIWALVVGVGEYDNFQHLEFTTKDAQSIYSFLRSPQGGAIPKEQIALLLDEEATAFNIQNTMADLFEQADTNDLIIFYFAGHGLEGAFLPVDYQENGSNKLYHSSINNLMMDSPAKFKLILADACHSGSFAMTYDEYKENDYEMMASTTRSGKSYRDRIKEYYKSFKNVKGGLAIIMSSASEEISLEAAKLEQGVFSYFLQQGLRGQADSNENNIVTVSELFDYISKYVGKFTYGFQTPNINGEYDENMPVGVVQDEE